MRSKKARYSKKSSHVPTPAEIEQAQMQLLLGKLKARNLTDPRQLKERIIWDNLKVLVQQTMGEHPQNKALLQSYEYQFKLAEVAENYHGSSRADYVKEESKSQ